MINLKTKPKKGHTKKQFQNYMKVINIIISSQKWPQQNKTKQHKQNNNNKIQQQKKPTQPKQKTQTQTYFKCLGAKGIKMQNNFSRGNILYLSFL